MKITRVTKDEDFTQDFRALDCGEVFERADVAQPRTIYMKTTCYTAYDLQFKRLRDFTPYDKVIVRCAELTVGPPEKP